MPPATVSLSQESGSMQNTTGMGGPPSTGPSVREQVATPAILLIIAGALNALFALLGMVQAAFGMREIPPELLNLLDDPNLAPYRGAFESLLSPGANVV